MAQTIDGITIDDGIITLEDGEQVGTVMQELKHGYHPCVAIRIGDDVEWLELDTKDLIAQVWVIVREKLASVEDENERLREKLMQKAGWK